MSNSNLEINDITAKPSPKDVTKFRLDEINKIEDYLNLNLKTENILLKKLVNTLLLLIMQTKFLLHSLHRLAL